ncbi:MAG: hypothetical protein EB034_24330, partial [Verrucomicrobia bacterium]|nr:hypothetical protein [Verrucomicrobiota bacterium]
FLAKSFGWRAKRFLQWPADWLAERFGKSALIPSAGHFSWFYSLHAVTMTDISHSASFLKL